MNKKGFVQVLVGVGILALLFYKIDFHKVAEEVRGVNIFLFALAGVSYLCYNLFMAYRLSYLLRKMGVGEGVGNSVSLKFSDSFFAHFAGMLASDVTPGRVGFFLVPYFLRNRTGCRISEGMAAILAPQGIEFILKVAGGFVGLVFFAGVISVDGSGAGGVGGASLLLPLCVGGGVFLGLGAVILWVVWTAESRSTNFLAKIPFAFVRRFEAEFQKMKEKSFSIRETVPLILVIYFVCWVLLAVQWQLIGLSLGVTAAELGFLAYFLLHPLITILRFVPVTVSGLGLMEGATAVVFELLGVGPAVGLSFALLVRLNMILVDCVGLKGVFSSEFRLKNNA